MAKQMLTAREVAELRAYYQRFPFDDESTQHVPAAQFTAAYVNAHRNEGSPPVDIADCLVFHPHPQDNLESDLDLKIFEFFKDK